MEHPSARFTGLVQSLSYSRGKPGEPGLVITQIWAQNERFGYQPAPAGGSIKPRVERGSAEPWEH